MTSSAIIAVVLQGLLLIKVSCQTDLVYESENIAHDGRTVLLGGLFPIHETNNGTVNCGDLHEAALQLIESMVIAINSVNEDRELLPKINLTFSIRDTCSNPSYGLEQAFQFVQRRSSNLKCNTSSNSKVAVSGVLGAYFSRVSINIANLLRLYRIPQISYISTADILGDKSRFDYFFRVVPPDSLQARAIADIIVTFKWTFVIALYSDDTYGNGGIDALIEHLNLHDQTMICIAAKIPLSVTATPQDYDGAIATMSQDYVRNATVAVLFGHLEAAVGMMEALNRSNQQGNHILSNLTWIGTDSWGDSLPEEYHSIAGGILSILQRAVRDPTFDDYFTSLGPDDFSNNVWFNELWESRFRCNLSIETCRQVRENMTLNTTDYQQVNHITLISDAVFSFAHAIHSLVESICPNGTLCDDILEDRVLGKAINGELLREELYKIFFQGRSSNNVSFERTGENMGAYFIKNLQRNPKLDGTSSFKIVGSWEHELSLNFISDIEWATGNIPKSVCSNPCEGGNQRIPAAETQCCWSCSPCQGEISFSDGMSSCQNCKKGMMPNSKKSMCIPIPIDFLSFSNPWSITLLILTIVGLIATGCIIVIFLVFHKHRVVKASSREVSAILLVGLVLCYVMPFFFVAMPSPAVCAIRRFGVGFSFAVCFSALLIKTNRIYRIFNQKSLDPTKPPPFTSPLSQVIMTLILIGIQVFGAIIWLAVDLPSTNIDHGTRSAELRCGESPFVYLVISLGYNFILLILSTLFAFLARKVPANYNEAKYINVTLYTLCIIWLAFVSTYFATIKFGAVFQATSLMIAIILSATTTLVCIFMPKVVLLVSRLKKEHTEANNTVTATNVKKEVMSCNTIGSK